MESLLTVPSYAKINLFLHILNKRDDGYHNIETIFQIISLKDSIFFFKSPNKEITISSNVKICNESDNTVFKACKLMKKYANNKDVFHIFIDKNIPIGGGLGGGSSNAATTLIALNDLWNCNLSENKLLEIAKSIGADVPFFIFAHFNNCTTAFGGNIGDKLIKLSPINKYCLIVANKNKVSTAKAFENDKLEISDKSIKFLEDNDYFENIKNTKNIFEKALDDNAKNILNIMNKNHFSRLSGTGSCMFSLDDNSLKLLQTEMNLKNIDDKLDTYLVKTI